jgi:hypothetical protein
MCAEVCFRRRDVHIQVVGQTECISICVGVVSIHYLAHTSAVFILKKFQRSCSVTAKFFTLEVFLDSKLREI